MRVHYRKQTLLFAKNLNYHTEPENPKFHQNLASAFEQKQDLPRAIHYYKASLRLSPNDPETFCKTGELLLKLGQTQEARSCFEAALNFRPDFQPARAALEKLSSSLR